MLKIQSVCWYSSFWHGQESVLRSAVPRKEQPAQLAEALEAAAAAMMYGQNSEAGLVIAGSSELPSFLDRG